MNENYVQPALPKGVEEGILKGMYLLQAGGAGKVRVTLMGSGTILREVHRGGGDPREGLRHSVGHLLARRASASCGARRSRSNAGTGCIPASAPRVPYVKQALSKATGPFIAATDYMRAWPDMIRQWVPGRFVTLGTDGFGRCDGRARAAQALRGRREEHRVRLAASARRRGRARQGHAQGRAQQARPRPQQAGPAEQHEQLVEVRVPDMGNFESVTVIDVLVKPGDAIDIDTPLVTLETDKATMDVPSTAKGVVEKVHVAKGGNGVRRRA